MTTKLTKYLQGVMDRRSWPQLMIFKDKHHTTYYLCDSQEAVGRASLEVLKQRMDPKYGYIRHPGPETKIYGLKPELTKEAAEALPEPYRADAINIIKQNAALRREWQADVDMYENANKALMDKDGNLAFMILHERRGYEYEGFTFEALVIP